MKLRPRFWGSTTALVLGGLSIISGLSSPARVSTLLAGIVAVIGAVLYRSAKRANLGMARSSTLRNVMEAFGIAAILAIVGLQRNVVDLMYEDPVPNLFIPLWVLIAYGLAKSGTPTPGSGAPA